MSALSLEPIDLDPSRRYIDLARLGRTDWRSGLGGLAWIVVYSMVGFVLGIMLAVLVARFWRFSFDWNGPVGHLISSGVMTAGLIAGVCHAVVRSQRRPFRSLLGASAGLAPERLVIGLAIALLASVAATEIMAIQTGDDIEWFDWPLSAPSLLSALASGTLVIPQAASEELIFRGWLTQSLGQTIRSRIPLVLLVAVLFAICHGFSFGWLAVPYFMLGSLEYSILSLRDARLELAIGAHIAHNWLVVATPPRGELPSLFADQGGLIQLPDLIEPAIELAIVCAAAELIRRRGWLSSSAA